MDGVHASFEEITANKTGLTPKRDTSASLEKSQFIAFLVPTPGFSVPILRANSGNLRANSGFLRA